MKLLTTIKMLVIGVFAWLSYLVYPNTMEEKKAQERYKDLPN